MNYKLIMTDNPILVSMREPIVEKSNDFFYSFETSKIYSCKEFHSAHSCYKIIAGVEDLPKLDLSLIAEEIRWVDVEKLAITKYPLLLTSGSYFSTHEFQQKSRIQGFIEGFKAAQSLNEKKYNKEYERVAKTSIYHILENYGQLNGGAIKDEITDKIFQSLSKPKEYLVEVEMEECSLPMPNIHVKTFIPKITNNTIKVTKILK